jgi:Activator of Hsp90 ATPase homolog 1-like protein
MMSVVQTGDGQARLPPAQMTGELHEFDARVGGEYVMSLHSPPVEHVYRGKTSETADTVVVRFVELTPLQIVEAVRFVTTDSALIGEMTRSATFEAVAGGTEVTLLFENLPPGLRAQYNEARSRLALLQLARRFE